MGGSRLTRVFLGLAAGPAAWIMQLLLGYGVSSYACFPSHAPYLTSPPPGWAGERAALMAVNLTGLALIGAGLYAALSTWRETRAASPAPPAAPARFLALAGVLACGLFMVAILADTLVIAGVPGCWQFAR